MSIALKVFSAIIIIIYFLVIFYLLKKEKFALKYSLLWIFSGIIMTILVIFPQLLVWAASLIGIEVASNGLFAICIFLEIVIMISLTSVISVFSDKVKRVIQNMALMEKRIRELEKRLEEKENERKER